MRIIITDVSADTVNVYTDDQVLDIVKGPIYDIKFKMVTANHEYECRTTLYILGDPSIEEMEHMIKQDIVG